MRELIRIFRIALFMARVHKATKKMECKAKSMVNFFASDKQYNDLVKNLVDASRNADCLALKTKTLIDKA
jgi:hypothetical protein